MFKSFVVSAVATTFGAMATLCGPHLESPDQITSFPTFPEGTTSLLSQLLTEEIWDELKDVKDEFGFTF
jgi:hypothetical protein